MFDLYDETADDDDFSLYIDRASTPVGRRSVETGSISTSRGSSATRSGHLLPPEAGEPVQRSSSCTGEVERGAAAKTPAGDVVEGAAGRLPRPRSAIVTRESAMDGSTTTPLMSSAHDDVATMTTGTLLTVPSSWYRTEVATNVGPGSRRLTANVQLGLPSPVTTSVTAVTATPPEVTSIRDGDNDNDVYFTLATSDSRISKYKTVGEQLTHKNSSMYNAIG